MWNGLELLKLLKKLRWKASGANYKQKNVSTDNHSQNISDWLWCSYEIMHYEESLISVFEECFASIKKNFDFHRKLR